MSEDDDPIFEMANLVQSQTGVEGIIRISTQMNSRPPSVQYFFEGRSFSVSIESRPKVIAQDSALTAEVDEVINWVHINHSALLYFWYNGTDWVDTEFDTFKKLLKKIT